MGLIEIVGKIKDYLRTKNEEYKPSLEEKRFMTLRTVYLLASRSKDEQEFRQMVESQKRKALYTIISNTAAKKGLSYEEAVSKLYHQINRDKFKGIVSDFDSFTTWYSSSEARKVPSPPI